MFTRPGPEMTCSTLQRPYIRVSVIEHLDLARRARAPVGMAALRRARDETPVDVVQHRFAESGPRRDHRGVPARLRDTVLQHRELVRCQHGTANAIASRSLRMCTCRRDAPPRDLGGIHEPRHVGEPRHLVGDCTRDAEGGRRDAAPLDAARLQELTDHRHQAVVVQRCELADLHGRRPVGRGTEQSEERLGTTDVACEQHGALLSPIGLTLTCCCLIFAVNDVVSVIGRRARVRRSRGELRRQAGIHRSP